MLTGQTTSIKIYNSIKQSVMAMPEMKHFALWNNQLNKVLDGDSNLFSFPACFVQFQNNYNQISSGRQDIDGTFILYICLQSLKQSDEYVLRFKDSVHHQLSKSLPQNGFSDFYRVYELQDNDYDNIMVWTQEYSYSYIDSTAADSGVQLNPYDINHTVHY